MKENKKMILNKEDTVAVIIDLQEKIFPAMSNREDVEVRAAKLIDGLRVLNIPIIVTQQYTKGLGETTEKIKKALCRDISEIGNTPIAESECAIFSDFSYIEKLSFSAAGEPKFMKALEKSEKHTVLVFGIESHVCVQQTVLDLLNKGYSVFVVEDCVSSRSVLDMERSFVRMTHAGATVTTYESALFELLGGANRDGFRQISKIVK